MAYLRFLLCAFLLGSVLWAQPNQPASKTQAEPPAQQKQAAQTPTQSKPPKQQQKQISEFEKLLQQELSGQSPTAKKEEDRPSWAWQVIKTALVLAVLLGIFWALWRLFIFKRSLPAMQSSVLRVLYQFPLMPGKFIQIVEVDSKLLFLGVSDAGVQLITEVTEKTQVDRIKLECDKDNEKGKPDFLGELSRAVRDKVQGWLNPQKSFSADQTQNTNPGWQNVRNESRARLENLRTNREFLKNNELFSDDGT